MNSYSQYGEDVIIAELLKDVSSGTYIDIGSGDPVYLSNTYAFYEAGWNGLLVEPSSGYHAKILELRPRDVLYQGAISDHDGFVKFAHKKDMGVIQDSWLFDEYKKEILEAQGDENLIKIPCMPLNELIVKHPQFHGSQILSIDVEGTEERILKKTNFEWFKPRIICIEYSMRKVDQTEMWERYLLPFYELVYTTIGNKIYRRK